MNHDNLGKHSVKLCCFNFLIFCFFLSNREERNARKHQQIGIETNCGWQTKIKQ